MIDASVIISYIDSKDTLPGLLTLLDNQDYPRDRFEVVLVNGDDYKPRASQAKGQQIGLERSKGHIIFLIDSDRFPPLDWISSHMRYYPEYDLVAGKVKNHTTRNLQAMSFGNLSMKREVLETIPIRDIVSQQDFDFAIRFIQHGKFKGILNHKSLVHEDDSARWSWKHHYLSARNIMCLRRKYGFFPTLSDVLRIRHPADLMGGVRGLFAEQVINAHD